MHTTLDDASIHTAITALATAAARSTCAAKAVGCVICAETIHGTLYYSGYNTSVSGAVCTDLYQKRADGWYYKDHGIWLKDDTEQRHKLWSAQHEIHAEIMALIRYDPVITSSAVAFVTWSPCLDCCKSLIHAGITAIYYIYDYDHIAAARSVCTECGVTIERLDDKWVKIYNECKTGH